MASETDRSVNCNCGADVDEVPGAALEDRKPCPECGGLGRQVSLALTAHAKARGELQMSVRRVARLLKRALQYVTETAPPAGGFHPESRQPGPIAAGEHALLAVVAVGVAGWQSLRRRPVEPRQPEP